MKNAFLLFVLFSFTVLSMNSCQQKILTVEENNVKFKTTLEVGNYHINNDSTQPSCNIKLAFIYPSEVADESVLDSLQNIFISCFFDDTYTSLTPEEAMKSYENNYFENYKEDFRIFSQDITEHDKPEVYPSYYETISNNIIFNMNGIISFQVLKTNYKGGAASYDLLKNYTINLNTLEIVNDSDLFIEEYQNEFSRIFREKLLNSKNVKSINELENIGYFGLDEIVPNNNFTLDEKGITYTFNKGEYSSLKADPIVIFIPYEEIEPLVKENSIIYQFVQ